MLVHLQVLLGRERGRVQTLGSGTFVAGRSSESDVIFPSDLVSRSHVQINVGRSEIQVADLGSSNGTYLNGARILGESVVGEGDILLVGDYALRIYRGTVPALSGDWQDNRYQADPPVTVKLAGRLDEIPPATLLRYLGVIKKTGTILLTSPPLVGQITLARGHISEVLVGHRKTRDAIQALTAILRWCGIFEFEAQGETPSSPLLGLDAVLPSIGTQARASAFPKPT